MNLSPLLQFVIYLLLGGLVIFLVHWILGMISLPENIKSVILVVIAIGVVIWLLVTFVPGLTVNVPRLMV